MVVGAGWALTISFAVLAFAWRASRFDAGSRGRATPLWLNRLVDSATSRWAVRLFGLAFAGYVAWAAIFGEDLAANPALGVFYVYLWVGMVAVSPLLGNVWLVLSPMRTVHLLLTRALGSKPEWALVEYPRWLGYWPAAAGLFAFVWTELVDPDASYVSTVVT